MRNLLTLLAAAVLALAIGGCSSMGMECCDKKEAKAMSCDMKAGCSCCAKKDGAPGHQH